MARKQQKPRKPEVPDPTKGTTAAGEIRMRVPQKKKGLGRKAIGPKIKAAILEALSSSARIDEVCATFNVSRQTLYAVRDMDKEFDADWKKAVDLGSDALEDEAVRRAKDGYLKPVFQGGIEVGHVREYSDSLMMFLLKGRRPEKFRERVSNEHSGPNGGPIATASAIIPRDLTGLSDDELTKLYREAVDPSPVTGEK